MLELFIIGLLVAMIWACGGPRDKSRVRPARCFRAHSCYWPGCTCHEHQP
jgi:hypothetical protein